MRPRLRTSPLMLVSCALLALAAPGFADGECRPATEAERTFIQGALAAFDGAIPPLPDGFETANRDGVEAPDALPAGTGDAPLAVHFNLALDHRAKLEASEAALAQAMEKANEVLRPEAERMQADLQPKLDALAAKAAEAAARNDLAEVERLTKEVEKLSAPATEQGGRMDAEMLKLKREHKAKDARLSLDAVLNDGEHDLEGGTKIPDVAGFPAWRRDFTPEDDSSVESQTTVFVGAYRLVTEEGRSSMRPEWKKGAPPATAQNLTLVVRGEAKRTRAFLDALKWDGLKALVAGR